ncbi:FixH family protein [Bacillus sp. FSL W8-0102]|uniref:FixH family protein n=1 Tax=Bacillus sp. FSL W8-0102 TaxID=2978205 RepID=UPI0019E5D60A|nr:FixH family protein [Bacillales bacterium]
MRKWVLLLFAVVFGLVVAACSGNNKEETGKSEASGVSVPLDVAIRLPKTIQPNQEVKVEAVVTQGREKVDDAEEVKFEIWKKGQEKHKMLTGKHEKDGVYSVQTAFAEKGTYVVVSHVTARGIHNMPEKEFLVGQSK